MFRRTGYHTATAALAALTLATAALAEDSTAPVPQTHEYTTENGGTITSARVCREGQSPERSGCVVQRSFTTADGNTFEQDRLRIKGAEQTRAFNRLTGPDGNRVTVRRRVGRNN